ncbi:MAG: M1 family aminopeptidase [Gemmatimonadales bacterium]
MPGSSLCPRRAALAAIVPLALSLTSAARGQQPSAAWAATFGQLRSMEPRFDRSAPVHGLTLRRDVAEFQLTDGRLFFLTDVAGRTIGAAYVGSGTVTFTPPAPIERQRAQQILGDSAVSGAIRAAVFLFADTTLAELQRGRVFGAGPQADDARDRVDDARDFLIDGRVSEADPPLMAALLDSTANGYFAAYVKRERGEDVMIRIDPTEVEDVQLLRRGRLQGQRVEIVCQFSSASSRSAGLDTGELRDPFHVERYRIASRISDGYDFAATATLSLRARRATGRWVRLVLFRELAVDSVLGEGNRPLEYSRANRSSDLWVRFAAPAAATDTREVRVVYHGPLIEHGSVTGESVPPWWNARGALPPRADNWAFIRSTWSWFPRYGAGEPADMDLTFRTPRDRQFASIGRLVDSASSGDTNVTHWATEAPTSVAGFNLGEFRIRQVTDPRIPPVTVFYNYSAHLQLEQLLPHNRYTLDNVAADVANSLSFFSRTFGPPLFSRYYATEIPYFHGEAFPGLIHLSWWTFLDQSDDGADEIFRAHEMAHQWWGIGVAPATYRDQWLAEGFAEFSGLWYMQVALRDNDKYFRILRTSREEIFRQRDRAAPIALGWRAAENRSGAYDLMIYRKGAWVLQMLRNLMLDTRTMREERFGDMMRDFYTQYRGKRASTLDFQHVVEDHIGMQMDWFFDEWVNGSAAPSYTFAWTDSLQADSTHLVRFRVRQEGVPPSFSMYVPLLIEMGDGRQVIVRVNVRGRSVEGSFPMPAAPARLTLNPLESVLAEVHTEHWD